MKEEFETLKRMEAEQIRMLLKKGLKPDWNGRYFVGFISIMAALHAQTKNWEWPSKDLYEGLSPQGLTTLVMCLEQERKE